MIMASLRFLIWQKIANKYDKCDHNYSMIENAILNFYLKPWINVPVETQKTFCFGNSDSWSNQPCAVKLGSSGLQEVKKHEKKKENWLK